MMLIRKSFATLSLAAIVAFGLSAGTVEAADPPKGFNKCKACHTYEEGGKNRVGPNLWGIGNKTVGANEDFRYSRAFKDANAEGMVWDESSLNAYLENPRKFMKGTKMAFPGIKDDGDRAEMVTWLLSLQ